MDILNSIKTALDRREIEFLSPLATHSSQAIRKIPETNIEEGYRQDFSIDVDRILNSLAYTRYIDKTQVFYLMRNDHVTHRVLHVQLVSKVSRTIGRFLGLNEDLIEAIALGHDIGHTPFGHDGEKFLSELCVAGDIGYFHHNVQSVQFLDRVEKKGRGWNLSLQVLDGILCHDGEVHNMELKPERNKTFETLYDEIKQTRLNKKTNLLPMSLEGCVVRIADTVSYIGRDIEDAIRLGMISRSDLPDECVKILGNTNGTIVYNLVTDIINNSFREPHIRFSQKISDVLEKLKEFNYQHIYLNPKIKNKTATIRNQFSILFERYMKNLEKGRKDSVIFTGFLENMSEEYINKHKNQEIVRDFIAGMTDQYFLEQCPEEIQSKLWMAK